MAEKKALSVDNGQSALAQSAHSAGLAASSAGTHNALQDIISFTPLDSNRDAVVQPFPRSPKLLRKLANAAQPSQEQLTRRVEELQAERSKTEARIQSLKKRKADLSRNTETMKQQVRERFESMVCVLQRDEQSVLDSLELDLRQTKARLDQVLKDWSQHRDQVDRNLSRVQRALSREDDAKGQWENVSPKKPDASEKEIRLNEERFKKLLKTLSSISKQLSAQLQRKTLLLDSFSVVIDRQSCHSQISVDSEGRGLSFSVTPVAACAVEHPLQFDKVCCALGLSPVPAPRSYWEVDVRCCPAWAVGVAYSSLDRKGRDKASKLGRNRNSWCVEVNRADQLSAWHNDRHVACQGAMPTLPGKVGVWVDYNKGQLVFYDADTMGVLQKFSAAVTTVFDRAHHQFTEPLYPAVRLLRPANGNAVWGSHLELCNLNSQ